MQFVFSYARVVSIYDTNEVLIIFHLYFFSIYNRNFYYYLKLNLFVLSLKILTEFKGIKYSFSN